MDLAFFYRKTPANLRRLKNIARSLQATLLRPFYPVSALVRLSRDVDLLQVDFMGRIAGFESIEGLRKRAVPVNLDGHVRLVASVADVIRSQRAAGRPQGRAVLEKRSMPRRKRRLTKHEALRLKSERALDEMIRRWLAVPMEKRTHFLRKRVGIRASCL